MASSSVMLRLAVCAVPAWGSRGRRLIPHARRICFIVFRFIWLVVLFLWFWFPVCPFSRIFRFACFFGFSGLFAFSGLPVCPFSRVSGLPVFSGFRLACFFWFPACPFSRAFRSFLGLFSLFSGFSGFFLFCIADFSVFCSVFARWLFCFVRSEGNTQIQCQNRKSLIIRYSSSGECPEMDTF